MVCYELLRAKLFVFTVFWTNNTASLAGKDSNTVASSGSIETFDTVGHSYARSSSEAALKLLSM